MQGINVPGDVACHRTDVTDDNVVTIVDVSFVTRYFDGVCVQ